MFKRVMFVPAVLFLASCGGSDGGSGSTTEPGSSPGSNTANSTIQGLIQPSRTTQSVGDVTVAVRGTGVSETVSDGEDYSVEFPVSAENRTVTLDFSGDNVVDKSMSVFVPGNSESVVANVDIGSRTAPIEFNLDTGGELKNPASPQQTSVTVPAGAFVLADGSTATRQCSGKHNRDRYFGLL